MGLFTWIIVGVVAGWLAGLLTKGRGFGLFGNLIIGVVGALLGGWIAGEVFNIHNAVSGFNLTTIAVSSIGAIIVLSVARAAKF